MKANLCIRYKAQEKGVTLWKVAQSMNVSESTLTRLLRNELPQDKRDEILGIINELAREQDQ